MYRILTFFLIIFLSLSVAAQRGKVALVLGGGGAKGAAEVGVMKVLEEEGIHVDIVVGTSIGALVGGLYAYGYTTAQLDSIFRSPNWMDLLTDRDPAQAGLFLSNDNGVMRVFGIPLWGSRRNGESLRLGFVRGYNVLDMLTRLLPQTDSIHFDSLSKPFRAVTFDIQTLTEIDIESGSLPLAMRASMSLPIFFTPVSYNTWRLIDGGVANNLPVDVARRMGAQYIIAIDLAQTGADLKREEGFWRSIRRQLGMDEQAKYIAARADIDLYFNPKLLGYGVESFSHRAINDMISIGERHAREQLPQIRMFKAKINSEIESNQ